MSPRRLLVPALALLAVGATALVTPVAAGAAPTTTAVAPIVVNGGFERPVLPDGAADFYRRIPGWTARQGLIEVDRGAIGPAAEGAQYVELDSTRKSIIEQVVTLRSATQRYSVYFSYAGRPGLGARQNSFTVQLDGTFTSFSVSAAGDSQPVWRRGSVPFTPNSTTATLRFICDGPSDGQGPLIDDVSIVPLVG